MIQAKCKSELLKQATYSYGRLMEYVESFSKKEQEEDFSMVGINGNIKDVLAHLHSWHLKVLDGYTLGLTEGKPTMTEGFLWDTTPSLNMDIQKRYAQVALVDIKGLLGQSYRTVLKIIEIHPDGDLFAEEKYHWTGSSSLGTYFISATVDRYHWAYDFIKKAKKEEVISLTSSPSPNQPLD